MWTAAGCALLIYAYIVYYCFCCKSFCCPHPHWITALYFVTLLLLVLIFLTHLITTFF